MNCYAEQLVPVYKKLGIDIKKMFCTMLHLEWSEQQKERWAYMFESAGAVPYTSKDKKWIKGYVYENHPHVTLLYGLTGDVEADMVKVVLNEWNPEPLRIKEISHFDSPDGEEYYCIIAKVDVSKNLCEARSLLEFLPHINTFQDYTPHITLGYIAKNPAALEAIKAMNSRSDGINALNAIQIQPTGVVYDNNSGSPTSIK